MNMNMNLTGPSNDTRPDLLSVETETKMIFSALRSHPVLTMAAITLITTTMTIFNRLYLHPLSNIPGPKLAAVTKWYQFYYDVIEGGTFVRKLPEWHRKYKSPVIRISPDHVHINDPVFYQDNLKEYLKAAEVYERFGMTGSIFCIVDPHKHRIRRSTLTPLFTFKAMNMAAADMANTIERAAKRLTSGLREKKPINIQQLYFCITGDSIFRLIFGKSQNFVESQEAIPGVLASLKALKTRLLLFQHFPVLGKLALNLPLFIAAKIAPGYVQFRENCKTLVSEATRKHETKQSPEESRGIKQVLDHSDQHETCTLFDLLLPSNPDNHIETIPKDEFIDEAFGLLAAGTDTTAYTLACGTYYLLISPEALSRLRKELDDNTHLIRDVSQWHRLQNLPYLTAVIQEILRLSSSAAGFFPRIAPPGGFTFKSHYIPGGTMVSSSRRLLHDNPEYFPDPEIFKPERWLGADGKELEKWNFSFSKGIRRCLGLPLANLEMAACLAYFFARFDMELYDTDASSMEWVDHGTASNKKDVEVKIIRDRWE